MIFSPTPTSLYRNVIGDQLRNTLDLNGISYIIDSYTLIGLENGSAIRDYFGASWELWQAGTNSKFIITFLEEICSEYHDDYKNHLDKVVDFCKQYNVPGNKVIIIAANFQSRQNILEYMINQLPGIHVAEIAFSEWLTMDHFRRRDYKHLNEQPSLPLKRFSMFSRHYKSWRHYFIGKLFQENLLKNFHFSFFNLDPYTMVNNQPKVYEDSFLIDKLKNIDPEFSEELAKTHFYQNLPFQLPLTDNMYEIHSNHAVDGAFASSKIHVTIETLFPYTENDFHATEKTYKPIIYKKPFLMFGSHLFLKNLRKMGYCTFAPYIDETYDTIANPKERALALAAEIKRISELSKEDFDQLLQNCAERVEWNFNRILRREGFHYGTYTYPDIEWMFATKR